MPSSASSSKVYMNRSRNHSGNTPPNIGAYHLPIKKKIYGNVTFKWFESSGSGPIGTPPPISTNSASMMNGDIYFYRDTTAAGDVYSWVWLDGVWQNATPSYTTHSFGEITYVFKLDKGKGKPSWVRESSQNKQSRQARTGKARANN